MPSDRAGGSSDGGFESDIEAGQEIEMVPRGDGDGQTVLMRRTVGSSQLPTVAINIIPTVREQLRRAAGEYLFAPQTMLIGPYHRSNDSCSYPWTEEKKKKAVLGLENLRGDLADLKQLLNDLGAQVRECYTLLPNDHYMDPEAFTSMLLHDGCYLLSFFIEFTDQRGTPSNNLEGGGDNQSTTKDNTIVRDILYLLENQIPLFVLDQMLHQINPGQAISALESISSPVKQLLYQQLYISKNKVPQLSVSKPSDLLHLVYSYFRRPQQDQDESSEQQGRHRSFTRRWRRSTDYSRYGDLRFRRRKFARGEQWTILDMHLQGGMLYIPFLRVSSSTWTMLRNLMALEEQEEKRPVTAYCYFMSQVACTAEDVDLLQRANILEHFLGSDEQAAKGFAELCDGVALDIDKLERNYLKPIWHDLDKRCSKPMHNFKGFFRQKYCGNVFYRLAFFVALLLTVSQVTQVIYAVIAYHKPPKAN